MPRFEYTPSSPQDIKRRGDRQGGNFDSMFKRDFSTWTPKEGNNNVRILPPTYDGHDHYGYTIWVHSYVGSEKSSYLCPKKMLGKRCPICEAEKEARDDNDKEDADQLKATERLLYWILDRDGDDPFKPLLWNASWSQDRDISALCFDDKSGKALLIDNPDEGFDITFTRKGTKLNTRYIGTRIDRDPSPISESARKQDRILDFLTENPLDTVLKFYPTAHLEEIISGTNKERDDDLDNDDDDDTPRRKRRRDDDDEPAPKKKARRRGDDDDDDEPAPKKKRRAVDDDDDDEPVPRKKRRAADDDDDEPAPKKKRRAADDDDDEPVGRTRLRRAADDDDDDTPQIRRGGSRRGPDDDDDDEPAPPKKKKARARDDDDDDEPAPKKKKRPPVDDDDDEPAPRKKRKPPVDDDDDDEPAPRKKRRVADDDDDD